MNKLIKKANTEEQYTAEQVMELRKCAQDPVYFACNYAKIQHPVKGTIGFDMYPYQENIMNTYKENRFTIVLSARQTGKSVTSAIYLLWYAIFNFDKTILIASNKNANAMEMVGRVRFAYELLPNWLKPGILADGWNKFSIGFDNGSRILSTATAEDSGRSLSISLLYLDEFAFVKHNIQEAFWSSISPTLSTGGQCIMTSTPNGDTNIFAQVWRGAQVGANGFNPIYVAWDEPPGRDEKFKEGEIGRLGERKWEQEYECKFLSGDALLVDTIYLTGLTNIVSKLKPIKEIKDFKFWDVIKPNSTYLVAVDPATGSGNDFSVIEVFEFPSLKQVAEFRSNTMSTNKLYAKLKGILKFLEQYKANVYFSVENNGVGEGIISLYEADEHPPELSNFISEEGKNKRGMVTTGKSKLRACVNLKELLENNLMTIRSPIVLAELKTFARSASSYAAQQGGTDDTVSALLITARLLEEISTYEQAAYDKLYSGAAATDDWGNVEIEYDETDEPIPMAFG